MNYYLLPKNIINIKLNILLKDINLITPFNSRSSMYFLNNVNQLLTKIEKEQNIEDFIEYNIVNISKIVNTYEFIFSTVPGTNLSVSKVKPGSNIFFELLELFHVCNIHECIYNKEMVNVHLSPNFNSSMYFFNIIREEENDLQFGEDFNINQLFKKYIINNYPLKIDFLYVEFKKEDYEDINKYIINMIFTLYLIVKYQNQNGVCIIKIDNIFYKGIIDILFILSGYYEKLYVIKPLVCSIISNERYIICKKFTNTNTNTNINNTNNILNKLELFLFNVINNNVINNNVINNNVINNKIIDTIIDNEIPYIFLNKVEESCIVIAQQQLEAIDQIINIIKNKNKDDKIETLKRNHIQKCIQWCEKYKIPHNKFIDKLNVFLNTNISNKIMNEIELDT
jgi:hypothetical protein